MQSAERPYEGACALLLYLAQETFPYVEKHGFRAMRRHELDADREHGTFILDLSHGNRNSRHACKVPWDREDIFEIQRDRIALLANAKGRCRHRRGCDAINVPQHFPKLSREALPKRGCFSVVRIVVACGENVGA